MSGHLPEFPVCQNVLVPAEQSLLLANHLRILLAQKVGVGGQGAAQDPDILGLALLGGRGPIKEKKGKQIKYGIHNMLIGR